jgi:hypothetical protein
MDGEERMAFAVGSVLAHVEQREFFAAGQSAFEGSEVDHAEATGSPSVSIRLEKSPSSISTFGLATSFCVIATDWRGSLWLSSNTQASGRPWMPPLALISSSARSKPAFHCAP